MASKYDWDYDIVWQHNCPENMKDYIEFLFWDHHYTREKLAKAFPEYIKELKPEEEKIEEKRNPLLWIFM